MTIDPYLLLNLAENTDDAAVKIAYLTAIRNYPPEQYPEIFSAIRVAYESLANERQRLAYNLFHLKPVTPADVIYASLHVQPDATMAAMDETWRQAVDESCQTLINNNLRADYDNR